MSTTQLKRKNPKFFFFRKILPFKKATLFLLSNVIFVSIILVAWFAGEDQISQFFTQIHQLQENPPIWLEVPRVTVQYLLAPSVLLFLIVLGVMKISPQPRVWSRRFVVGILLIIAFRYIIWRSLSTLNLNNPLNGAFSLGLFFFEMFMVLCTIIQLFLTFDVKSRHREADEKSVAVIEGRFTPSVDILIPTYNEPVFILRRTIIGCQALEYPHKTIYLLDDTQRLEMKELADQLGCEYITRPDNKYAKAGNLNHAIGKTHGELIVVFDADFVPTKNFLTRTVGFFQDENIALVQTPQSFYNADPIARNLGLENVLTSDEEVFYRQIQPFRDAAGSVICAGTSFIVRRSALNEVGGFATDSLSEDYYTGIRISAKGHRLIYLNEKLSAGLAAENFSAYAIQRIRWARGTLQAFFIKSNPLTIPGLNPIQRLAHLEGLLSWFTSIARVYFLFMPLAYSFLGVIPLKATAAELIYFFLPYYLINIVTFAWLNHRSRSALLADIYSLVICFPLAITVIQVMLNPFTKGFKVTPKGALRKRYHFNWGLALPLIILFIATALSLWQNMAISLGLGFWASTVPSDIAQEIKGLHLGWLWSLYNLVMISMTLLILIDAPKTDIHEWFDLRRIVRLSCGERSVWGVTTMISEGGAEVALTQKPSFNLVKDLPIQVDIVEENLLIDSQIVWTGFKDEFPTVRVRFESVSMNQQRRLIEMLFCRPGQWKRESTPGELSSLLLIFRILLKPRILFNRKVDSRPISVVKV
ncbi:glycosyltransferase [Scytonema sp. NUACC21]